MKQQSSLKETETMIRIEGTPVVARRMRNIAAQAAVRTPSVPQDILAGMSAREFESFAMLEAWLARTRAIRDQQWRSGGL
jgi:hypothetical protein